MGPPEGSGLSGSTVPRSRHLGLLARTTLSVADPTFAAVKARGHEKDSGNTHKNSRNPSAGATRRTEYVPRVPNQGVCVGYACRPAPFWALLQECVIARTSAKLQRISLDTSRKSDPFEPRGRADDPATFDAINGPAAQVANRLEADKWVS